MNYKNTIKRLITAFALIALFAFVYVFLPAWMLSCGFALIGLILLIAEWSKTGIWWLTPIYPVMPFILLISLNQTPLYHHLILFIIALSGSFDMGAYAIGTLFGTHKITPRMSPKKSWEGLVGGFLLTYATSYILLIFYPAQLLAIILALLAGTAAFTGDLFASWIKRRAGIKDFGSILPGHGGLLDRFDSILFVTIIIYCLRNHL
jgi:phosphatidate cytidylyltransferase